ncbi:MAG: bifunctional (p)ppGpp synthetase/guanosine-3',5'-bis(diphosphate) 3'-pyrophosphohydrolase [Bacillota bacterium]|nr:bifunctional (p)ppGpp synthetase/guanosine-3',5'-bis(diphosphate) 3'-pyrophosphohydrolase [Bacillota bacterium]
MPTILGVAISDPSDFAPLRERASTYLGREDVERLEAAFRFASEAHRGQFRASGEPYIIHPLSVAGILADLELDAATLEAALLHDVVEDTGVTLAQLESAFDPEVALLVDGVTKLGQIKYRSRVEEQAENLRKMFLAMAKDIRVILIKLADRLHNMRTLEYLPPEKRRDIAQETLDIFAPLAHRLGIYRIKWELEDLAFRFLEPDVYRDLARRIPKRRAEREGFAEQVMEALRPRLAEVGIKAELQGRAKHFYSIYQKMYHQGKDLNEIYDLVGVRVIIVDTVRDCYGALGVVHTLWRPIPGRFKDYIATPKPNMYQSLHTTVVGPQGEPFEIQIRTWEMHRTAEYGIAAHWKYKEGYTDPKLDQKLNWLREILEWQKDLRDPREFMESLKIDIFPDEVFVFTPKGDVIPLPRGATPIDFAYAIHTEIGHHCVGAKVNGHITPLSSALETGDIVEIITSKQSPGPSSDWLSIVKTASARAKIRQWFKRERREENLARGREILEREVRRLGGDPATWLEPSRLEEVARRLNLQGADELLVSVGYGGVGAAQVLGRLRQQEERLRPAGRGESDEEVLARLSEWGAPSNGVRVKGIDNVLVRFPRCCNPVPGEPIVGYVTQGRGVSVHRVDCPNIATRLAQEPERRIEVTWDKVESAYLPRKVVVTALDRPGLLSEVAQVVAENRINIVAAQVRPLRGQRSSIEMVLEVRNRQQLENVLRQVQRVRDVLAAEAAAPPRRF